MKAEDFDRMFDDGVDMADHLDLGSLRRPNLEPQRLELQLPSWMATRLARHAEAAGVRCDELIERWLAERLEQIEEPIAAE